MTTSKEIFKIVYDAVALGKRIRISEDTLKKSIKIALLNKVLLQFLRNIELQNEYRYKEEKKFKKFLKNLQLVSSALKNINHLFIKLHKPVVYVPADIDILLPRNEIWRAYSKLRDIGFDLAVVEPYTVTMVKRDAVVDLYVHPSLGGIIYINGIKLLEHKKIINFNGIEIPVPDKPFEALLTITHAFYKEKLYTLNDYIVVKKWLTEKTLIFSKELNCINAVSTAIAINKLVDNNNLILPYSVPFGKWLFLWKWKLLHDKTSRASLVNLSKVLRDHRFGRLILSKILRESY